MKAYIELTSVPITRENTPILAPAADLAERLAEGGETVELRVQKEADVIHCYIGISSLNSAKTVIRLLKQSRCCFRPADQLWEINTETLLMRDATETYHAIPGQNRGSTLVMREIIPDAERSRSLYYTLGGMQEGYGYAVLIRKLPQLDMRTSTMLKHMAEQNGNSDSQLYEKLFQADARYQGAIAVFGKEPESRKLLEDELAYAFAGMKAYSIPKVRIDAEAVWKITEQTALRVMPRSSAVVSLFLAEEIRAFASLEGIAQRNGIRWNCDTLFPAQESVYPSKEASLLLGKNEMGEEQRIALREVKKHMFVAGAPGAGKGNLLFSIANQLHQQKIPVLLMESAKEEQHYLRKTMPHLRVWRPQSGNFVLNPFALPPNVTLEEYRASLKEILRTCFKGEGPLEELYQTALTRCFARYGYSQSSMMGDPGTVGFGIHEFMLEFNRLLDQNGYSGKTKADIKSAGHTRIRSLLDANPDVYDTAVQPIPITELLRGENLLQLNCLTTIDAKQMFATMILISLAAYLRINGKHSRELQLVIILDEAHNLLRGAEKSSGEGVYSFAENFQNLLLELRSIGVGFIIADQTADNIPSPIPDICGTKIFLGPSRFSGIERYAELFRADEKTLAHLYLLGPGEGVWITYRMSGGAYFSTPNIIDRYQMETAYPAVNSFAEGSARMLFETFLECRTCPSRGRCTLEEKQQARQVAISVDTECRGLFGNVIGTAERAAAEEKAGDEKSRRESAMAREQLRKMLDYMAAKIAKADKTDCCITQLIRQINRESGSSHPVREIYVQALRKLAENKKTGGTKA